MNLPQLIADKEGYLRTPFASLVGDVNILLALQHEDRNPRLLYQYPSGDCDWVKWPSPNRYHLASTLYDAREIGDMPDTVKEVLLPDGSVFVIDAPRCRRCGCDLADEGVCQPCVEKE